MKLPFCIFAVGALLRGASCDSSCIEKEFSDISSSIINYPASNCNDLDQRFERARERLKSCTRHEVNFDGVECVMKDLCTFGSAFRRDVLKHRKCIIKTFQDTQTCENEATSVFQNYVDEDFRDARKALEICTKFTEFISNCTAGKGAKECGDEAGKVIKRMTDSIKPVSRALCLEAGNAEVTSTEGEVDDGNLCEYSSAAPHSATRWTIAIGILIAMMGAEYLTLAMSNVFGKIRKNYL